jgi:hypothetical protein
MAPRADTSQSRIAPPSAASAGEARHEGGGSKPGASVFLEHNLVSAVILVIAAAATLVATARLASLGTWWTRVAHALSRAASG